MRPSQARVAVIAAATWIIALSIVWSLYQPGLSGSFIFDDAPNLGGLNAIEPGNIADIATYSLQGIAGPSGRPLSLLTFALQHESWPKEPESFKRINILIHLLNANLVLWLLVLIQKARSCSGSTLWALPIAAATLWMLWPIQVSSVLYVIQRMTLLSGTCVFLGLILYIKARTALDTGTGSSRHVSHCLFLVSLAIGIGMGILFKENAIIFPLLVIALDRTLLVHLRPVPKIWITLLWTPIVALAGYLALSNTTFTPYQIRDFNLTERLLTESRVLWMYAMQILAPSASSLRFLYDDFLISRSLLSPSSTLLAVSALLAAIGVAWTKRRQCPTPAFAVLFFCSSHALESTVLPLELVFEHRNYVGSLAIAYALAYGMWYCFQLAHTRSRRVLITIAGTAYMALAGLACWNLTTLWADPLLQKRFWFEQNPASPRVHMELAAQLLLEGHADAASVMLDNSSKQFPTDMSFPMARVELACYYPELRPASLDSTLVSLAGGISGVLSAVVYLDRLSIAIQDDNCPIYSINDAQQLIDVARRNPAFISRAQDLVVLSGSLYSYEGNVEAARAALKAAIAMNPTPKLLVQAAAWELGNKNMPEAQQYLSALKDLKAQNVVLYLAVRDDIESLDRLMLSAASSNASSSDHSADSDSASPAN